MQGNIRISFKGLPQLQRRVNALDDLGPLMRDLALDAVGEQKRLAPVKTGNLRRSIHLGRVTARSAETIASANYAGFVEFGTTTARDPREEQERPALEGSRRLPLRQVRPPSRHPRQAVHDPRRRERHRQG